MIFSLITQVEKEWDWKIVLLDETSRIANIQADPIIKSKSILLLEREEPYESTMEIGKGIDLLNNVYGDIVNNDMEIQGLSKPEMQTFLEIISDENQRSTIAKEMARSDIPTKGIQAGIQYISDLEANSTSMFIIIATTIVSKKTKAKNADLKPTLRDNLNSNKLSFKDFMQMYGTHYISGYTNGAQFIGIIEIYAETKIGKHEIRGSFNKTSFPSVFLSIEAKLDEKNIAHRKNIKMFVKGVTVQKLPVSIQDLILAHEDFISETRKAASMPLTVTCSPFAGLPGIQANPSILHQLINFNVFAFDI